MYSRLSLESANNVLQVLANSNFFEERWNSQQKTYDAILKQSGGNPWLKFVSTQMFYIRGFQPFWAHGKLILKMFAGISKCKIRSKL